VGDPTPRIWHSLSMDAAGDVIVAGEAGGMLHVSTDGGSTWNVGASPSGTWTSSATSSTGNRIYAVAYFGNMYLSTDDGANWTALSPASAPWEGIATSADGMHVAAVAQQQPLMLSSDGGATWHNVTMPDGLGDHWWRSVAMSDDGTKIVAVAHTGEIFRTTDGGTTWSSITVSVGGAAVTDTWYRVKTSADGQTIAVVGNTFGGAPGTGIYVSHDGGTTWTKGFDLVADYTFLAMSADGQTIGATVSNMVSGSTTTPGRVVMSSDGGATFTAVTPGSDTNWRAIAMSANGSRVATVAGGFDTGSTGLLYIGQ
jgi:photosystem II stability/assembly factor-like uncharacterized protein